MTNQKQKILVFHPALASYRVDFFNALNARFDALFYFELKKQFSHTFSENYLESKCDFQSRYLEKGFTFMGRYTRFGMGAIIDKERPDVVICSEYNPTTFLVFLKYIFFGKKFRMYTISDDSVDVAVQRKGMRSWIRNLISKNIDGIIFPSQAVCDWYTSHISEKPKTLILPIIHSDDVFRAQLKQALPTRDEQVNKFGLQGKKVVLFVGRLAEEKNVTVLLQAMAQLKNEDWRLVIVGDGNQAEALQLEAKQLQIASKTIFTGRLEGDALLSWYSVATIFVLPSTFEPYGAVINEALLAGCIAFCSEIAGAATLVSDANGIVFSPENPETLANSLDAVLCNAPSVPEKLEEVRENKMLFSFREKMNLLFSNL